MPRWSCALAALAGVGALGGCGAGGEEDPYVAAVNAAHQRFAAAAGHLSDDVTPTSSARSDRRTLRRYEQAVDRVVADLRAIRPPAEAQALHGRLVGALAGFGRSVDVARGVLDERDPRRVRDAHRELREATGEASARLDRTVAAINRELGR